MGDKNPAWVYGDKIPGWLRKLPLNAELHTRRLSLFADPELGLRDLSEVNNQQGVLPWDWKLVMSAPERAIVEALDELPRHEGIHHLDMVFENLTTLRPRVISNVLNSCRKIKVRRLFFVFADRHNHAWRKHLNPENFDLGNGDRALVNGGRIHPRYRIMVPAEFARETGNRA